jgi:hypothetical protein
MPNQQIHALVEYKLDLLPTGAIRLEVGLAATPDEFLAGRVQWTRLAMTPEQALQLADDLRQKAASSHRKPDGGRA